MKHLTRSFRVGFHSAIAACVVFASAAGCGGDRNHAGSTPGPTRAPVTRSDLPYDSRPDVTLAEEQTFVNATNGFGLDLFRRMCAVSEKNLVFSPLSLGIALSMAYAGAAGDTAAEMKTVLRDPFGNDTYYRAMNQLLLDLRSRNRAPVSDTDPRSIELAMVDAVWLQQGMNIRAPFLDVLASHYDAGVHLADFTANPDGERVAINNFAGDATKGQIRDLIPPGAIDAFTRAALLNAAYLKASWERPFSKELTVDGSFRVTPQSTITVPMMRKVTGAMRYASGPNFQAVELPYVGGDLKMLIVLPAEGQLQAVRNSMDDAWFRTVAFADTAVFLSLPKFRITWGPEEFKETLAAMGTPRAFDRDRADFSNITTDERLYLPHILQKAFVGIDESGTEAAAVSVAPGGGLGSPEPVQVDHPFLFAIVDKSGAVLFAGQVMDPR
ncbi:serpin family protein [Mycobacterium sp. 852014-50255_SCH5639931]|uniref:serpin family protein n=1 Tax=Mycobacterium sp. 852014-50255_SCH5639931 TaxID=1834112 RepID=UPI0018D2A47E|nr:serpin family protein [Mycobacterium sp. 852014-50255_SCH5639931]